MVSQNTSCVCCLCHVNLCLLYDLWRAQGSTLGIASKSCCLPVHPRSFLTMLVLCGLEHWFCASVPMVCSCSSCGCAPLSSLFRYLKPEILRL